GKAPRKQLATKAARKSAHRHRGCEEAPQISSRTKWPLREIRTLPERARELLMIPIALPAVCQRNRPRFQD
ncbi:UNVERIFIED_CONTAM: hypothetical protein GTU68_029345, partial [Idotea baltica]|nr:hypothetical protein [Idotea baltica]